MTAKFFFFTDPAMLGSQAAQQAYGPAAALAGKDRFRVTDLHAYAQAGAPVLAICDGLVCAQMNDQGTLTLVLKPSQQPPFDFPAISYILYKGVDPTSLLATDGTIDTAQENDNNLISAIKTAWELVPNGNTGSPSRACLGLHLNPTDYPAGDNSARFADTQPLDTFFYDGDPAIQLPLARGGWRLGTFSTTSPFGIEIVVERIGRRPKIGLARTAENIVEVDTLVAGADDATVFRHWDAKEAILDFVDPCAFWGSFFITTLRVWNGASSQFDKLTGDAIYQTALRGTATGAANFANRNRAYLDIRNEHGHSLNYYQADGPNIQLTLDAAADIDNCVVNYYASGWPSFAIDNTSLLTGTTGDRIDVRFALPKTANTRPLLYISAGYRGALRRLKDRKRFIDRQRRPQSPYLYDASLTIPLADDAGAKQIFAGYQKVHQFKRLVMLDGQPVPQANPGGLAPLRASVLDYLVPLLTTDDLPVAGAPKILRTFDEVFYVDAGVADADGFVTNPAIAADDTNVVLILVPKAHDTRAPSLRPATAKVAWPSLALPAEGDSIFQYLAGLLPSPLETVKVADPQTSGGTIELLYNGHTTGISQTMAQNNPSAIVVSLSHAEMSGLKAIVTTNAPTFATPMLSLVAGDTYRDDVTSYAAFGLSLNMLAGAQTVGKLTQVSQIQIYRHDDL